MTCYLWFFWIRKKSGKQSGRNLVGNPIRNPFRPYCWGCHLKRKWEPGSWAWTVATTNNRHDLHLPASLLHTAFDSWMLFGAQAAQQFNFTSPWEAGRRYCACQKEVWGRRAGSQIVCQRCSLFAASNCCIFSIYMINLAIATIQVMDCYGTMSNAFHFFAAGPSSSMTFVLWREGMIVRRLNHSKSEVRILEIEIRFGSLEGLHFWFAAF